jgi:hypothetical protein
MNGAPIHRRIIAAVAALVLGCAGVAARAQPAQDDALKVLDNPGGGQVVYGTIDGKHSAQSAMALMLKTVHGHFGGRPQVSKVFQVRGSSSYGAFFTLIASTQGGKAIAGEVIVDVPPGGQPAGALLYDEADRFGKTAPALLRALGQAWQAAHPAAAPGAAAAPAGQAQPLRMQTAGDRSASIGLPEGWQLLNVSGGQVSAEGPNGEKIGLGIIVGPIRDPAGAQNPRLPPVPGAAPPITCSPRGELFDAYVCAVNQVRERNHQPPASFQLTRSRTLAAGNGQNAVEAVFDVDLHDGKGPRSGSARIGTIFTRGLPTWAMTISNSSVPKTVAAAEAATMTAIIASYSQDARVINSELQTRLGEIHAIGERSKAQAQAADERRVASARAFEAHMDNIDRQSKAMQNYTLDRSQIQDNERNGRATVSNGLADALVHADPDRYEIVPTANFLKGVDY